MQTILTLHTHSSPRPKNSACITIITNIYFGLRGDRVSLWNIPYMHYASLTARSLSPLVTLQCNLSPNPSPQCVTVHPVPKCRSCHKAIMVITGRAHYCRPIFHSLPMQFEDSLGLGGESPCWTFTIYTMHRSLLAV